MLCKQDTKQTNVCVPVQQHVKYTVSDAACFCFLQSAPPSPTKGKSQSVSPSPSSAPGGSTPPSTSGSGHRSHRVERSAIQPATDPGNVDRWRATEEGRSRSSRGSKDMKVKDSDGHGHVKHNGSSHGQHEQREQQQSDHPHRSHRSSQDGSRDAGFCEQQQSDHPHRSHRSSKAQVSDLPADFYYNQLSCAVSVCSGVPAKLVGLASRLSITFDIRSRLVCCAAVHTCCSL